jgi:hypothetical protein
MDHDVRAERAEIFDTTNVIWVPMCNECMRYRDIFGYEYGGKMSGPRGLALSSINQDSVSAFANKIRVCALILSASSPN